MSGGVRRTVVSFHAHPDDEALLTGGTLARLAAEGHRVVLVVATAGEAGLASGAHASDLGARGAASWTPPPPRSAWPGSRCSGTPTPAGPAQRAPRHGGHGARGEAAFAQVPVERAAGELARLLDEERADVLTTYDAAGGYGHPDHVQVHRVGRRAAELAGTPVVLEATVDRAAAAAGDPTAGPAGAGAAAAAIPDLAAAYTDRAALTHRVDVRHHLAAKRAALRAHASQAGADDGVRTVALLLRLPPALARRVLGTEWFREPGRPTGGPLLDDVLASLSTSQEAR